MHFITVEPRSGANTLDFGIIDFALVFGRLRTKPSAGKAMEQLRLGVHENG